MKIITMPSFGADMAKGEVAHWNIKPGDPVKRGDIIASIETMKGLIDMEVFDDGVIDELLVDEGTELAIGEPIARLRLADEKEDDIFQKLDTKEEQKSDAVPVPVPATERRPELAATSKSPLQAEPILEVEASQPLNKAKLAQASEVKISPAARKKAEALGIEWQKISRGSGPDGAIVLADIETHAKKPEKDNSDAMRKAIGSAVSRAKREIPHYYLQHDVVVDKAQQWLNEYNRFLSPDKRILISALTYCAISRAVAMHPEFNGFYVDDRFRPSVSVHLGNVINLRQGGLVVAAIHDAQKLNCKEMMSALKDQVMRAREGGLRMSEMQDATVTVSNLGERGCDSMQSIIFTPQVAIIGIGRQRIVPWIINGEISAANILTLTLAADHRVSDGHTGARLLNKINKLMQEPEKLV